MVEKDKTQIPGGKTDSKSIDYKYYVSEGSNVILDATDLVPFNDIIIDSSYSWKQIEGTPVSTEARKENSTISFTAPYVKGGDITNSVSFELTIKDKNGKPRGVYNANVVVKRVQRAIIFQGGVAVGAYEAGVFQALVEKIGEEDRKRGLEKRPLFDIVAGASIGAWNAALVVINASKSWEHSAREIVRFWRDQEYPFLTGAELMDPISHYWWDGWHHIFSALKMSANNMWDSVYANPYLKYWYEELTRFISWGQLDTNFWKDYTINGWYIPATGEAARRYYSAYQCEHSGVLHVASGIPPWSSLFSNGKFFDFTDRSTLFLPRNLVPRTDNKHWFPYSLKETLKRFTMRDGPNKFPLRTNKSEPRFILVTLDVKTGDVVTFDSYEKRHEKNHTKYYSVYGGEQNEHTIFYERGVEIEHVLASGAFPSLFDYPKFTVSDSHSLENKRHNFWDGNLISSTPLREVIQAHRDHWHDPDTDKDDVPDLEVYIADLWPSVLKEEPTSFDLDFVENRKWNIIFSDKTDYDEQVAKVVTDFSDLARHLISLAKKRGASPVEIDSILEMPALSENRNAQKRCYKDLLGGRFRLTKVLRIDRKDDGNGVFDSLFDYSRTTIENLMRDGYCDALTTIGIQTIRDRLMAMKSKSGSPKDGKNLEDLESHVQQIDKAIKVGNGYDSTILNQLEDFIHKVESLPDDADHDGSIKEEKAFLVNAAKQFEETITEARNLNCRLPQTV